jgi:hypothetical protein
VEAAQRFTRDRPCPVCGGYDQAPCGQGIRCFGYLSANGRDAFCTREELAGDLPFNTTSLAYRHTLEEACDCGDEHEDPPPWSASPPPEADGRKTRRLVATYSYRDENGTLLYQVCRFAPGLAYGYAVPSRTEPFRSFPDGSARY